MVGRLRIRFDRLRIRFVRRRRVELCVDLLLDGGVVGCRVLQYGIGFGDGVLGRLECAGRVGVQVVEPQLGVPNVLGRGVGADYIAAASAAARAPCWPARLEGKWAPG